MRETNSERNLGVNFGRSTRPWSREQRRFFPYRGEQNKTRRLKEQIHE